MNREVDILIDALERDGWDAEDVSHGNNETGSAAVYTQGERLEIFVPGNGYGGYMIIDEDGDIISDGINLDTVLRVLEDYVGL